MKNRINIMFLGDSICVGQHVALHEGWIPRISKDMAVVSQSSDVDIIVTNTSANGRTSRQALLNIEYEVQSHSPEILLIQFGMNDCNYWRTDKGHPRVSKKAFEANLEEIISRVTLFGTKKIFLNTNHPTLLIENPFPNSNLTYQQSNEDYNNCIRRVAAQSDVELIDIEAEFFSYIVEAETELQRLLLEDQLHLSVEGHQLYHSVVYPRVLSTIKSWI